MIDDDDASEASAGFIDEVDKQILTEAPTSAWYRPRKGDVVTVEVRSPAEGGQAARELRTWAVGAGTPFSVAGVELDRCVRTMRCGEVASVKLKSLEATPARVELLTLERTDDLLENGKVLCSTVKEGTGWQKPKPGSELRMRYSWRMVAVPNSAALPTDVPACSSSASTAAPEGRLTNISVLGSVQQIEGALASSEMAELRRLLLQQFQGSVVVSTGEAPALQVRVLHSEENLIKAQGAEAFSDSTEALASFKESLEPRLQAIPAHARKADSKEVSITLKPEGCLCSARDWIPGPIGSRVLADLRVGQRCLVQLSSDLVSLPEGLERNPNFLVEYDLELLRIFTFEDLSLDSSGRVLKKITKEGESYEKPSEASNVEFTLEAQDEDGKAVLAEKRQLICKAISGRFCSAVEETVLTMKKGEVCEVLCSDPEAWKDTELCLQPGGASVRFTIELLDFEKIDTFTKDEAERIAYCTARKEVGTRFFQQGCWRRALKRYQVVIANFGYLESWTDPSKKEQALTLRKACHLNVAMCWLKLGAWSEAEQACSAVLGDEPESVKALFRRGQALKELKQFEAAEQCFRKVLAVDKDNKEAARMLLLVRQLVKDEVEQQKQMFSRMARGIRDTSDEVGDQPTAEAEPEIVANEGADVVSACKEESVQEEDDDDGDDIVFWAVSLVAVLAAMGSAAYFYWRRPRRW